MAPFPDPRISRDDKTVQLSYELPHRIHTAQVYPVTSSNGSTIIVYGHESGVRIVWRGGRPFKAPAAEKKAAAANGVANDSIMLIDSDDDEEVIAKLDFAPPDYPKFEETEEPVEPVEADPPIMQSVDLPLGVAVLHLAFPSSMFDSVAPSHALPTIVKQRLIIVAACSDQIVRAITLPLSPPSPAFKEKDDNWAGLKFASSGIGRWGEQVVALGGEISYQDVPNSVACTFTLAESAADDDDDDDDDGEDDRSRRRQPGPTSGSSKDWDLMIAAHSPEMSGILHIYRLPVVNTTRGSYKYYGLATDQLSPFQTQYLSSPASHVSFNPSAYPAARHSHLLLALPAGSLKVYECLPPPRRSSRNSSRRRSSYEIAASSQGSWQMTLYPPFAPGAEVQPRRKRVLDGRWVLSGRAILVLLHDGEWGVWDIECAGPASSNTHNISSLLKRGVQGGATTAFSLSGHLSDRPAKQSRQSSAQSNFALRTPSTRQREEQRWFFTSVTTDSTHSTADVRGGLAVAPLRGSRSCVSDPDDAVVIWHGSTLYSLPSLRTFWTTQLARARNGGSLFSADGRDRLMRLGEVALGGESVSSAAIVPVPGPVTKAGSAPDVVVAAEHRLLLLRASGQVPSEQSSFGRGLSRDDADGEAGGEEAGFGDLELHGIERQLEQMHRRPSRSNSGRRRRHGGSGAAKRKVGFV